MTNVSEKTMPVSAIMPDATDEQIAWAAAGLIVDSSRGMDWCSRRGRTIPANTATDTYPSGIDQTDRLRRCWLDVPTLVRYAFSPAARKGAEACSTPSWDGGPPSFSV